jgi:hypothetical protein
MSSIEDQINQLFSTILLSSRDLQNAEYAGESFNLGTGPLRMKSDHSGPEALLSGSESILGLGHPLTVKSLLLAALEGGGQVHTSELNDCIQELEVFLSSFFTGVRCTFGLSKGREVLDLGRTVNFFSEKTRELLQKEKMIYSNNFFSVPITLHLEELGSPRESQLLSRSSFRQILAHVKLIKLGQIYGFHSALEKKEALLLQFFKQIDKEVKVDGLIVHLDKPISNDDISVGPENTLYFPYLFDNDILNTIGGLLGK